MLPQQLRRWREEGGGRGSEVRRMVVLCFFQVGKPLRMLVPEWRGARGQGKPEVRGGREYVQRPRGGREGSLGMSPGAGCCRKGAASASNL